MYTTEEVLEDLNGAPLKNIFTKYDYHVVRQAVASLEGHEHSVVMMRFWENQSVDEIAELLDIKWQQVERILRAALKKLKQSCVTCPDFSRAARLYWQAA